MARTVPVYTWQAENGQSIRFAADSNFWITDLSGDDGLDISLNEQQAAGQIGKSLIDQSVGSRTVTVTGAILRDLDAGERRMKQLIRPMQAGKWIKTVGNESWYLDAVPQHTPDVSGTPQLLNFQFKLKAAYPYWRTVQTQRALLGGMMGTWFPTPISTKGSWQLSSYNGSLYTTINNTGNAETPFTLQITARARCKNPMLWHNAKRTYIKLLHEMQAGERVQISTHPGERGCIYTSAGGTAQNGFRWLDIDSDLWLTLEPGENVLRFTADEGRENATAVILAPQGVASSV